MRHLRWFRLVPFLVTFIATVANADPIHVVAGVATLRFEVCTDERGCDLASDELDFALFGKGFDLRGSLFPVDGPFFEVPRSLRVAPENGKMDFSTDLSGLVIVEGLCCLDVQFSFRAQHSAGVSCSVDRDGIKQCTAAAPFRMTGQLIPLLGDSDVAGQLLGAGIASSSFTVGEDGFAFEPDVSYRFSAA